jgi:glycosyltransferase involved in cell wall biosynthesis
MSTTTPRIAVITSGFPRISETFALNELLALERAGALAAVFATKDGDGRPAHPGLDALIDRVQWIAPGTPEAQGRWVARRLAARDVTGVHAYFAHTPAEVAERAAGGAGVPYSFSAHARDVRKVPRDVLRRRARRAACVIACNPDVAGELRRIGADVELVPHGVDLSRFVAQPEPRGRTPRVLAVGRLVEKKGFRVLLDTLAASSVACRLEVVGDGPLRGELESHAATTGASGRVRFAGALTHHEMPAAYAEANLIVVPSVSDAGGDRDGLPNVVLEAMASARAVVASEIAAIPVAVRHGETGLLVPPGDRSALREALETLAGDPSLRARMGAAGRRTVEREFELGRCTERLLDCLEAAYA